MACKDCGTPGMPVWFIGSDGLCQSCFEDRNKEKVMPRTRLWESDCGCDTMVQFRTDSDPMVFIHSNIGWLPIGNAPKTAEAAEKFALKMAEGYDLVEASTEKAEYFLG